MVEWGGREESMDGKMVGIGVGGVDIEGAGWEVVVALGGDAEVIQQRLAVGVQRLGVAGV